ncbi:hypothetical protein FQN54_002806 [Arachnomyces sp. PD_36]|nr:hypothetical protein FQN54_002806 [Arachnomyces sp. PD_36]
MPKPKRTTRLSVRKSHPDLRQGRILDINGSIPQRKKCLNGDGDGSWGPRYRSSGEEERKPVSYHRSWCGAGVRHGEAGGESEGEDGLLEGRGLRRPEFTSPATEGYGHEYLLPAGSGIEGSRSAPIIRPKPHHHQEKPPPISPTTRPTTEESFLPTLSFSPETGTAVRLPGSGAHCVKNFPKPMQVARHPRRSVYEIYFGDDFGPDFEAAQVATEFSAGMGRGD